MNVSYPQVIASLLLSFCGYSFCIAQSSGPEFLQCTDSIVRLCIEDEGIRLPATNQVYLGEENPDATSCGVHVRQSANIQASCGNQLQYEVNLYLYDTSHAILLKPLTSISIDSSGKAELVVDTEFSSDTNFSLFGLPYNKGCNDFHRIEWIVIDSCGNQNSCSSKIHLLDCSQPVTTEPGAPYIIPIPLGYVVHLFAKDFSEVVKDDCSRAGDFLYSLDDSTYVPDRFLDPCSTDGFSIELPWTIWIADSGNDLNCDNQIDWLERNISAKHFSIILLDNGSIDCWMDTGHDLSGEIMTESMLSIKGVEVMLNSPGHVFPTYVTASDGKYFFSDIDVPGEVEITAFKNDFHKNGVSTLDLVKIQKHLLGKEEFDSPYKLIAADANNSQNVSAIDMIELRKLILGIYTVLPANLSWRFVRANYIFQDTMNPWPIDNPGTITISDLANPGNLDFIGIKIGDVNNTVTPNLDQITPRGPYTPIKLLTDQQSFKTGDIINVPISISSDRVLSGFQFTMTASDMEILNILPGVIEISEENYALFGDHFTISWFDENNVNVLADEVLFTVQLRALSPGHLNQSLSINSAITDAELYMDNEEIFLPVLTFKNENVEDGLKIISSAPNPWKELTNVSFYLPESDQVVFSLFDVAGRKVFAATQYLKNGNHEFQLNTSCFADRGMMFFEISTSIDQAVKKMIVLD